MDTDELVQLMTEFVKCNKLSWSETADGQCKILDRRGHQDLLRTYLQHLVRERILTIGQALPIVRLDRPLGYDDLVVVLRMSDPDDYGDGDVQDFANTSALLSLFDMGAIGQLLQDPPPDNPFVPLIAMHYKDKLVDLGEWEPDTEEARAVEALIPTPRIAVQWR